jgi:hypothetical protein
MYSIIAHLMLTVLFASRIESSPAESGELFVVMAETGRIRDGLPVFLPEASAESTRQVLLRGFSGRWLKLFQYVQAYRRANGGPSMEPAYLLLSSNEGGFPRFGFWSEGQAKKDVGYVDLHRRSRVSGRFGSLDQIFPHELAHIIFYQLAGEPPAGGANQVHAIGLRTDPVIAFHEGFAEHVQTLTVQMNETPLKLAIRVEAFNVFNHTRFAPPNTTMNSLGRFCSPTSHALCRRL